MSSKDSFQSEVIGIRIGIGIGIQWAVGLGETSVAFRQEGYSVMVLVLVLYGVQEFCEVLELGMPSDSRIPFQVCPSCVAQASGRHATSTRYFETLERARAGTII